MARDADDEDWIPGSEWFTRDAIDRRAAEFIAKLDPRQYVGTKHHIVPRFILARFANNRGQVYVRERLTPREGLRNIKDLAVRDFYTFINDEGELDSSFESLLGEVEKVAAAVLRDHLDNPFMRPRPFDTVERMAIDSLVSMQAVRGHAHRRRGEILADYYIKATNRQHLSDQDMVELEFVPHQNELLKHSMMVASKVHQQLAQRACFIVTFDRPLLLTCDEPVLLGRDNDEEPLTAAELNDHPRRVIADGVRPEDLIQITGPRAVGVADADGIAMPLSPRHALVYDQPGTICAAEHVRLTGEEAGSAADEIAEYCVENAYAWLAGHPDHPALKTMKLPKSRPPVIVIDGGTPMSRHLQADPRRIAHRLDKNARPDPVRRQPDGAVDA
ncbi:MAG: DUF4238 domain-containing protein [Nocardioidaceae bacterium]|nr:DUF4238 domain-containing protein [Nocardioidaceae bacterium]